MQRINDFLAEPDVPDWATTLIISSQYRNKQLRLSFEDSKFTWNNPETDELKHTQPCFILGPLSVKFPPGCLSLITGTTGSGKSALLLALLGGSS